MKRLCAFLLGAFLAGQTLAGVTIVSIAIQPSPDGKLYSNCLDGSCGPPPAALSWNASLLNTLLAPLVSMQVGIPVSIDVRQALSGTDAASALISFTGTVGSITQWTAPGSGDDVDFDATSADSGSWRLDATDAPDTVVSGVFAWVSTDPAQQGNSPTLFQDLSGRDFNGEPGALAVNDSWATTVYDYVTQFAPTIPTLPTPTGNPSKPTDCSPTSDCINPNAANEYLVVDTAGFAHALNDAAYRYIFIAKGTDLHGMATQSLTRSGTSGAPRWFIYWDNTDPSAIDDYLPWQFAVGTRVEMPRIDGSQSWTYFVGLNWGSYNVYAKSIGQYSSSSANNVWYRINLEGWGGGNTQNWNTLASLTAHAVTFNGAHDNTFYEFYAHHAIPRAPANDYKAININSGNNNKIISSEFNEFGGAIQIGTSSTTCGTIIEDTDIYKEWRFTSAGAMTPGGTFTAGEGFIGLKEVGGAGCAPTKIYGVRAWGARPTSPGLDPTSNTGAVLQFSSNTSNKRQVDVRWSVFEDNTKSVFKGNAGAEISVGLMSFVRSIINDHGGGSGEPALQYSYFASELYLSTVNDAPSGFLSFAQSNSITTHDGMGNMFIDVGTVASTSNLGASARFGYNAWLGSTTPYNKTYGNDQTSTKAAANMGNFTYRRKKLSGPETSTINGIVPTSSTPSAIRTMVPDTGGTGNNQVGSRTGIGVDNLF